MYLSKYQPYGAARLICLLFVLLTLESSGIPENITVDSTTLMVEGKVAPFNTIKGGDTIFFNGGHRPFLLIRNIHGDSLKPVIMINNHGCVIINTDHHFGISVENSSFFRFTGSGDTSHLYGFRIERVKNGGGMGITTNCSNLEIDHIYISGCPIGGLYAKTDPDCSFLNTREKFTQRNTLIHDNYIANVGNEGMYIGSTKYFGMIVNCNGTDTLVLPPLLSGVKIFRNILDHTGWDGIQVSSASEDCHIYDNTVLFDSQAEHPAQMSGIIIGGGSSCDCYNNYISGGKGSGIEVHGTGRMKIYNNIIENAGKDYKPDDLQAMKYGIYVTDISTVPGYWYYLLFNTIVNPKSDGIRFISLLSRGNVAWSNVIINPGNFDFYETGHFGTFKGHDSYIMIPDRAADLSVRSNYYSRQIITAGFDLPGYTLQTGSPLIDAGEPDPKGINFDFLYRPRPHLNGYDAGAYEFNPAFLGSAPPALAETRKSYVAPNPVGNEFNLYFYNEKPQDVSCWITDVNGITVARANLRIEREGMACISKSVAHMGGGTYFYLLNAGKDRYFGRFIKKPDSGYRP